MKSRKLFIRIVCIILAVILALSLLVSILASLAGRASFSDDLQALETERQALSQQQQEMDARIQELKNKDISALSMKAVLDEQMILTQREIDNINDELAVYSSICATWDEKIALLQADADNQLEDYKLRLRAMEENGTVMYYSVLFDAKSISDFLARLDFMLEIMEYDNKLYDSIITYQSAIKDARDEKMMIEDEMGKLATQRLILEAQLEVEVEEATALISKVENNVGIYPDDFEEIDTAEKSLQESVGNTLQALQRQEATIANIGTGDFIWPCLNNRNVVMQYGTDLNESYGIYTYHSGIDIAADYGADVLAADGGTVVLATYDPAFGYYILINHGTGATTMYAHLSKVSVTAGATVLQGQVIGKVGATGAATRTHLHFEVSVGGNRVNPLDYFSMYNMSW